MSNAELRKVAILVTRPGPELLVFHHDRSGIQVPAGTVEPGEDVHVAAMRELEEETGLIEGELTHVCSFEERFDDDEMVVAAATPLYARADRRSEVLEPTLWRTLVRLRGERVGDFARVAVEEWNIEATPPALTSAQEGWVEVAALRSSQQRHVFHVPAPSAVRNEWEVRAEGRYVFRCYWASLDSTGLIDFQQRWVDRAWPYIES